LAAKGTFCCYRGGHNQQSAETGEELATTYATELGDWTAIGDLDIALARHGPIGLFNDGSGRFDRVQSLRDFQRPQFLRWLDN